MSIFKKIVARYDRAHTARPKQTKFWTDQNFQQQIVTARAKAEQTENRGWKYGDQVFVNEGVLSNRSGTPLYWDVEKKQATTKVTPVPYRYTGEGYALLNNIPVPAYKENPALSSKVVAGQPMFWNPWENSLTTDRTEFPVFQELDPATGQMRMAFQGSNPYLAPSRTPMVTTPGIENEPGLVKGPTGEKLYLNTARDRTVPEIWSDPNRSFLDKMRDTVFNVDNLFFGLDATTSDVLSGALSSSDRVSGMPVFATLGSMVDSVRKTFQQAFYEGEENPLIRVVNAIPLGFGLHVGLDMVTAASNPLDEVKPKSEIEIRKELERRGYYADSNNTEGLVAGGAALLATKNPLTAGFLGLMAKPLRGMFDKRLVPVEPGSVNEILNYESLKDRVDSGEIEWLSPKEFAQRSARASWGMTQEYIRNGFTDRDDLVSKAEALGFDSSQIRQSFSPFEGPTSRQLLMAASKYVEEVSKNLTDEAFQTGDIGKRLQAIELERSTYSPNTRRFDPYFQWTFINRPDLEKRFLEAVASVEVRTGQRLNYQQIWAAKDQFSDPMTELIGDMVVDLTNVLDPIGANLIPKLKRFVSPFFTRAVDAVASSTNPVGKFVYDLGGRSVRSAGHNLAKAFNEVALSAAEAIKRSPLADKKSAFRDLMQELGQISSKAVPDKETLARLSIGMPEEFAGRQQRLLLKLGTTLSDERLAGMVGPNVWGDLVDEVSDDVYRQTLKAESERLIKQGLDPEQVRVQAENLAQAKSSDPANLTIGLAQKVKDEFVKVNRPVRSGAFAAILNAEEQLRWTWVKFVLSARPAWVFRNWTDNLFRMMIFGANPFSALDIFDPSVTERLTDQGLLVSDLTTTFVNSATERDGKTFAQRVREGWRPKHIWDVWVDSVKRNKDFYDVMIAEADAAGNLWKSFTNRAKFGFDSFTGFVSDFNSIVEYASRSRMYEKALNENMSILMSRGLAALEQNLRSMGITDPNLIEMVKNSWQNSSVSPAIFKQMLNSFKLGDNRYAAYLMSPVVESMLSTLPAEQRSRFVLDMSERLKQAMETARLNGEEINEDFIANFFDTLLNDFEEKMAAASAVNDTRVADDPVGAADRIDNEPIPDPVPTNAGAPPVESATGLRIQTQTADQALASLQRFNLGARDTFSNLRDALGSRASVRVADAPFGAKYQVVSENGAVIVTLSPDAFTLNSRESRAMVREIVGDVLQNSYADLAPFATRSFKKDFDLFLRDPQVLKTQAPESFNWFARNLSNDPALSNILLSLQRKSYLKYLDFVDGSPISPEVAEYINAVKDAKADAVVNMMPQSYLDAGKRQRATTARFMDLQNKSRGYSVQKIGYIQQTYDVLTLFRDRAKRFLIDGWPSPKRRKYDTRGYYWDAFAKIGESIYNTLSDLFDETAARIDTLSDTEASKGFGITLGELLDRVGFRLDFAADGSLKNVILKPELTGKTYKRLDPSVNESFLQSMFGSFAVNGKDVKKLFTDMQLTRENLQRAESRSFADFVSNVDATFRSVNHRMDIRQELYDIYDIMGGANKPETLEEWKGMVDTATTLMEAQARPWVELTGRTVEEFWDEYLSQVVSSVEVPQNLVDRGGLLGQISVRTDSPEFTQWFDQSKVVDPSGKPLVVYHGTPNGEFSSFSFDMGGANSKFDGARTGFFFTNDPKEAEQYAMGLRYNWQENPKTRPTILPVYLSIKNPKMADDVPPGTLLSKEYLEAAKAAGHDGVIHEIYDGKYEYVIFDPTQVKSVFNRGSFSPEDAAILHQMKPELRDRLFQAASSKSSLATLLYQTGTSSIVEAARFIEDAEDFDQIISIKLQNNDYDFKDVLTPEEQDKAIKVIERFIDFYDWNDKHNKPNFLVDYETIQPDFRKNVTMAAVEKVKSRIERARETGEWFAYRVTDDMRRTLRNLGYPPSEINKLTPFEADIYSTYGLSYKSPEFKAPQSPEFKNFWRESKVVDSLGNPVPMFHATDAAVDFQVFARPQLGYHFGPDAAAADILRNKTSKWGESGTRLFPANSRVGAYWLSIQNPLELDDLGVWSPHQVLDNLKNREYISLEDYRALSKLNEEIAAEVSNAALDRRDLGQVLLSYGVTPEDAWFASEALYKAEDGDSKFKALRQATNYAKWAEITKFLKARGYDGVKYLNKFEGYTDEYSWIVFDQNQIKSTMNVGAFSKDANVLYQQVPLSGNTKIAQKMGTFDTMTDFFEAVNEYFIQHPSPLGDDEEYMKLVANDVWRVLSGLPGFMDESHKLADIYLERELARVMPQAPENIQSLAKPGHRILFRMERDVRATMNVIAATAEGHPGDGFQTSTHHIRQAVRSKAERAAKKGGTPVFVSNYPTVSAQYNWRANVPRMYAIEVPESAIVYESNRARGTNSIAYDAYYIDTELLIDSNQITRIWSLSTKQVDNARRWADNLKQHFSRVGSFANAFRDRDPELARAIVDDILNLREPRKKLARPFIEVPYVTKEGHELMQGSRVVLVDGSVVNLSNFTPFGDKRPAMDMYPQSDGWLTPSNRKLGIDNLYDPLANNVPTHYIARVLKKGERFTAEQAAKVRMENATAVREIAMRGIKRIQEIADLRPGFDEEPMKKAAKYWVDLLNEVEEYTGTLAQSSTATIQGATLFQKDGKAILYAFKNGNISTVVHEFAHIYRRVVTDLANMDPRFKSDLDTLLSWTGESEWTIAAEEKFARGFERYLYDGIAPNASLQPVFSRMKKWMREIYLSLSSDSPLGLDLDREVEDGKSFRTIMDGWFNYGLDDPQRVTLTFQDWVSRDLGFQVNELGTQRAVRMENPQAPIEGSRLVKRSGLWRFDDPNDVQRAIYGNLEEITEKEAVQYAKGLRDVALVDEGSGLLNGLAYKGAVKRVTPGSGLMIVHVDVDGLKAVNRVYSSEAGDNLISAVAGALTRNDRIEAYRTGGDEISLIIKAADQNAAIQLMDSVRSELDSVVFSAPTAPNGRLKSPQISYGVGMTDDLAEQALLIDKQARAADGLRGQVDNGLPALPRNLVATDAPTSALRADTKANLKHWFRYSKNQLGGIFGDTIKTDIRDPKAGRRHLEAVRKYVMTDNLTGAKTKIAFEYNPTPRRIVNVDAEGLKYLNDTFTHAAGNDLIKAIHEFLNDVIDQSGHTGAEIYRFTGTNFVVSLSGDPTRDVAILDALDQINRSGTVKLLLEKNGKETEYGIRTVYASGGTYREAVTNLEDWIGELRSRGIYSERGTEPSWFVTTEAGPGSERRWFDYQDYREWSRGRDSQGEGTQGVEWIDLTPEELEAVNKVRERLMREQRRESTLRAVRGNIGRIADKKLEVSLRMTYQELLSKILDIHTDRQAYGENFVQALLNTPWGSYIAPHLPKVSPATALIKEVQRILVGEASTTRLASAIREAAIFAMENGIDGIEPHPYVLNLLGKEAPAVSAAADAWAARNLNPDEYLDQIITAQKNADQVWKVFVDSLWYGDRSVGKSWGQFAQSPEYFAAYLTDMIASLKARRTMNVPDQTIEALELLLWQTKNFKALVNNFAGQLGTLRSRLLNGARVPLSPNVMRLPEGYLTWFFGTSENMANMNTMREALTAWKDDLKTKINTGKINLNFSEDDLGKLLGGVDDLTGLKQTLRDMAIYGTEPDFKKQVRDTFGFEVDDRLERKLVEVQVPDSNRTRKVWEPLSDVEVRKIKLLQENLARQNEIAAQLGINIPEGALPAVNRFMIDYGSENKFDEMIKRFVPFWMFTSRSFPFWLETMLTHPLILSYYVKYIQYQKRTQAREGITTSDGRQLPSLVGYMRIPGTEMWFNPTAALSFRYIIPTNLGNYQDEYEGQSILSQVFFYLNEYAQIFGVGISPFFSAAANLAGYMEGQPVNALLPMAELLPPWWQKSFRNMLYKMAGESQLNKTIADMMVGSELPWRDYLVERRILANVVEQFNSDSITESDKITLAKEAKAAIKMREAHPLWNSTLRELEEGDLTRSWGGYFTGIYAKQFTDGEVQLLAIRNEMNAMRDTINDQLGAQIFDMDLSAESRYENYQKARFEGAEGLIHQLYNSMRYTQVPDLSEASGFRALTGEERRDYITHKLYTDEVTSAYYETMGTLRDELLERLRAAGIGASSEMTKPIWDWYLGESLKLKNNPIYEDAWRTWSFGYKPETMIYDHFRETWWQIINETRPQFDHSVESYDTYQQRLEEWKQSLPSIVEIAAAKFEQQFPAEIGMEPEVYQRQMDGVVEMPGGRMLNVKDMISKLRAETTYEGYETYRKAQDNELEALDKAWEELYWNPYWDKLKGMSGYERSLAERQYLMTTPKPGAAQLIAWVQSNYPGRFDVEVLQKLMDNTDVTSIEQRLAPTSEADIQSQKIWDILFQAGPSKKALQKEFESLGGYWSDVSTWYNVGGNPSAWDDPERFKKFYDTLQQAADNLGFQEPDNATLLEWSSAQALDGQLKDLYLQELGEDYLQVMTNYWNADSATRRALRKSDPRIDQYYQMRDAWESMYPLWAKYYVEDKKSNASSGSGGSGGSNAYSGGGGSGGGYRYRGGGSGGGGYDDLGYADTIPLAYRSTLDPGTLPGKLGTGGYGRSIRFPTRFLQIIGPVAQREIDEGDLKPETVTFLSNVAKRHPEYQPLVKTIIATSKGPAGGRGKVDMR